MYESIRRKDPAYDGKFYTAVKTTGIFCRTVCTAKKPLLKNVEFFKTTSDCLAHGYRPCKVCKPMEKADETPEKISKLMDRIIDNPSKKYHDSELAEWGISGSQLRRWFIKNHRMTFQAFQRLVKINAAFKKIQNGSKVSDAAYDSGYESISGFAESFKNIFGIPPSAARDHKTIALKRIDTPIGPMISCASDQGICLLEFADRRMLETELKDLSRIFKATIIQEHHPLFDHLEFQLKEYFEGCRKTFDILLDPAGTEFQQAVWKALQEIPYGSTRSYKQQAEKLGNPLAIRAIAQANGMNRIAILIPCHRVIGSDGQLTGYGGGLWRKKFLLELEERNR